jgi:hypothetical protein
MIANAVLACALAAGDAAYVQGALDGWAVVTRDLLRAPDEGLPWMVLYNRSCAFHLAPDTSTALGREAKVLRETRLSYGGRPVPVRALPVTDAVRLPNGAQVPVAGLAFTSVYGDGDGAKPFFVTALPEVWKQDPKYAKDPEDWEPFVLEVLSHELVHTRQMVAIRARLEALDQSFPLLPDEVDDDWLQEKFEPVAGVRPTVLAEIELLYQAAAEPAAARSREIARTALALMRARRATYYGEAAVAYSALEDVFLNMEGVACWSAFQLSRTRRPGIPPDRALEAFRGNRKYWSQEEGLALFLVLDRFVPDWRPRVLPPELASPVALLERALEAGAR